MFDILKLFMSISVAGYRMEIMQLIHLSNVFEKDVKRKTGLTVFVVMFCLYE